MASASPWEELVAELGAAFLCADLGLTAGLAVSPTVASCSPVAPVAALEWHAGRSNAPDAHRWSPPQPPSVDEGDFFWGGECKRGGPDAGAPLKLRKCQTTHPNPSREERAYRHPPPAPAGTRKSEREDRF